MQRPLRPLRPLALALLVLHTLPASAQESAALFDAPVVVGAYNDRFGALLDLDGDGFDEPVSWWWKDELAQQLRVWTWSNDRAGKLTRTTHHLTLDVLVPSPSLDNTVEMGAYDADGDAYRDFYLLLGGDGGGQLHAFRSLGVGFEPLEAHAADSSAGLGGVVFADFDADGWTDRALAVGSRVVVTRYVAGPSGPESGASASLDLGQPIDALLSLDLDGDGGPDLYANCGGVGHLLEVHDGVPLAVDAHTHGITDQAMPAAGDVDGDGDDDLVVFGMQEYVLLRHAPGGGLVMEPPVPEGGPATHLFDVDGDGDLDGLCCGGGGCGCCGPCPEINAQRSMFLIAFNDGNGGFAPGWQIPGLGSLRLAGASDLDHDGDADLVGGRCVYYPRGPIQAPPIPLLAGPQVDASVADLDRDGDPDASVGRLDVQRNAGDGAFAGHDPFLAAPPTGALFAGRGFPGDFDGDGDVDLVVRREDAGDGSLLGMSLLRNDGGGSFSDAGPAGPPGVGFDAATNEHRTSAAACVVGDADGDGDLDLITRTYQEVPGRSKLWINEGPGVFHAGPLLPQNWVAIHLADFDADGLPDLLMNTWSSASAALFWGIGGGALDPNPTTYFGGSPLNVSLPSDRAVVGDFDADGDLDVAAIETGNSTYCRLYFQNDARQFPYPDAEQLPPLLDNGAHGWAWRYAAWVDVDADGVRDWILAPAPTAAHAAVIARRTPADDGWQESITQVLFGVDDDTTPLVQPGALADVDGDGDTDLLTDRLVRNRRFEGPAAGTRRQEGPGAPALGGPAPTLGASGPFRVGEQVRMRLTGAPAQAHGALVVRLVGVDAAPFGAGTGRVLEPSVTQVLVVATDGDRSVPGSGHWLLEYQVPAYKAGRSYVYEVTLADPGAGTKSVRSNLLRVTYGP